MGGRIKKTEKVKALGTKKMRSAAQAGWACRHGEGAVVVGGFKRKWGQKLARTCQDTRGIFWAAVDGGVSVVWLAGWSFQMQTCEEERAFRHLGHNKKESCCGQLLLRGDLVAEERRGGLGTDSAKTDVF